MNKYSINAILATVIGGFVALIGGWDKVMEILVTLIIMDYLTGVGLAIKDKKLNSEVGAKGLLKKATIFIVIIVAAQLDRIVDNPVNLFRTAAGLFFIANEGISILENAGKIGLPLPAFLKKALEQLKGRNDEEVVQ